MSKRARHSSRITNEEKHPQLYKMSKRHGRSYGPLVMGLYGVKVTSKILNAQKRNNDKRSRHS